MATTSQESDSGRVKQWGNEFPAAAGEAGTGSGTGQCRRSDAAAGPQGDAGKVTARATRFNPPPGWPPAPAGWVAPPGWQLAGLLYVGFILIGINGVPQQDPFGYMTTVKFSPAIGIILAAAGCGAAFVAAIMSFHRRND